MTPEEAIDEFERRNAREDSDAVVEMLTDDAVFFFNDGTFRGREEIRKACEATWAYDPEEESYTLHDIRWLMQVEDAAACTYTFVWEGVQKRRPFKSVGRGTAVLRRDDGVWKVAHQHLSADPAAQ